MSTNAAAPVISSSDRLSFMLIIALALHVLLIFGITFSSPSNKYESQKAKEVIEVKLKSDLSDEESDFLANSNQIGSGEADEKAILTTTEEAEFNDQEAKKINPNPAIVQYFHQPVVQNNVLTTQADSTITIEEQELTEDRQENPASEIELMTLDEISKEIESLEAKLDREIQTQANKPKKVSNTAMSAKEDLGASYVLNVIKKIEGIGNNNYPQAAITQNLSGSVQVAFKINRKGELIDFEITRSSGHTVLDNAVKHIITQSSPFDKFNPKLIKAEVEQIETVRTWIFDSNKNFVTESN